MADILDPKYVPDPSEVGSQELFNFKNQFMYSVLLHSLLTDTAKTFVREHAHDMDAQKVLKKLQNYMKDSPRTTMEITRLTKYITSIRLDSGWKGTSEQFLLHFKEQFCLLDDLVQVNERMSDRVWKVLLKNAVQEVPFLRNITNTDEYQRVFTKDRSVNYEQYFNLLLVAAQSYDLSSNYNHKRRTIYQHQVEEGVCNHN